MNLDEDLVLLRHRPVDVGEPEDLGWAVAIADDGFHERWIGPP